VAVASAGPCASLQADNHASTPPLLYTTLPATQPTVKALNADRSVQMVIIYIQVSVGGLDDIHSLKNARRLDRGLPPLSEDTHDVCRHMRASSPPASAADLIDQQQQIRRSLRTAKKVI